MEEKKQTLMNTIGSIIREIESNVDVSRPISQAYADTIIDRVKAFHEEMKKETLLAFPYMDSLIGHIEFCAFDHGREIDAMKTCYITAIESLGAFVKYYADVFEEGTDLIGHPYMERV